MGGHNPTANPNSKLPLCQIRPTQDEELAWAPPFVMSMITEIVVAPLAVFGGCVAFTAVTDAFDIEELRRKKQAAVTLDMSMSAAAATKAGLGELTGVFEGIEKDESGKVSSSDFGRALVGAKSAKLQKYFGDAPADEVAKAFERLNADGSKQLNSEEFERGLKGFTQTYGPALRISDTLQTNQGNAELQQLFKSLDTDADGRVSSKEWGSAVVKNVEILRKLFGGVSLPKIVNPNAVADEKRAKAAAEAAKKAVEEEQPKVQAAEEEHKLAIRKHKDRVNELEEVTSAFSKAEEDLASAKTDYDATPKKKKQEKQEKESQLTQQKLMLKDCQSNKDRLNKLVKEADSDVANKKKAVEAAQQALKQKQKDAESASKAEAEAAKASESFQAAVQQVGKTFARLDVDSSGDLTWEEFEGGAAMVGVAALELGESENIKALRDGFR